MKRQWRSGWIVFAAILVCIAGVAAIYFVFAYPPDVINTKGIKKMSYELRVSDFVSPPLRGPEIKWSNENPIQGTVDPVFYSKVLACFDKAIPEEEYKSLGIEYDDWQNREVILLCSSEPVGEHEPVVMWVTLGWLGIEYQDGQKIEVDLYCTFHDVGAFEVTKGKDVRSYRGGSDTLFINTLVSIHRSQESQSK